MTLRIKHWKQFQHFRDRRPPWIKLYRGLLDDPDWAELKGDDAKALVMLWLIASEDEGRLPDVRKIAFRLRTTKTKAEQILTSLSHWLEQDDITAISPCYQDATPETETETETETDLSISESDWPKDYEQRFWTAYPRRIGKAAALRKLAVIKRSGEVRFETILTAVASIEATEERFIPHPLTWLNQGRYLDAMPAAPCSTGPPAPPRPGLPTREELEARYAVGRKNEGTAAESAGILASSVGVSVQKQNGLGVGRNGHAAVRSMGEILSSTGLETVCDQANGEGDNQENDYANGIP